MADRSAFEAALREEMDRAWDAAVRAEAQQLAMLSGWTWCPSEEDIARWEPIARAILEREAGLPPGASRA